jgi:hypothetical protein
LDRQTLEETQRLVVQRSKKVCISAESMMTQDAADRQSNKKGKRELHGGKN